MNRLTFLTAIAAIVIASSAQAALITFDDKGLVRFDNVTDQYASDGVIFSGLDDFEPVDLEAVDDTVFGDIDPASPPIALSNFFNDNAGLRADIMSFNFLAPASGIEFDYNPAGSLGGDSIVNLYNSSDMLIDSFTISDLYAGMTTPRFFHVVVPTMGVSRLDLVQPTDNWGHYVDNLAFEAAIPAPATLLLMGIGLLGLAARKKSV